MTRHPLILALMLAVALVRGMVPAGWMPDQNAWANGRVAMVICTGNGPMTLELSSDQLGDEAPAHTNKPCDFALASLPLALADAPALPVPAAYQALVQYPWNQATVRQQSGSTRGARAPPFFV